MSASRPNKIDENKDVKEYLEEYVNSLTINDPPNTNELGSDYKIYINDIDICDDIKMSVFSKPTSNVIVEKVTYKTNGLIGCDGPDYDVDFETILEIPVISVEREIKLKKLGI